MVLGRWLEPPIDPVENRTKPNLTTRKICVPLVPVDNLSYIYLRNFRSENPDLKMTVYFWGALFKKYLGGFRVTRVIYS